MAIGIDRAGSATLAEALVAAIERAIGDRRLSAGARLPSIRRLADEEGVSKSTVVEAYDRLVAAGRIVSKPGAGFYVAERRRVEAVDPGPMLERDIDPRWVMRSVLELPDEVLKPGWKGRGSGGRSGRWPAIRPRGSSTTPIRSAFRRCAGCWRSGRRSGGSRSSRIGSC